MKGLFITFEGGEGSGKTTIIKKLKEYLESLGLQVVQSREPGGSKIAESIRQIILDKENIDMDYMTEALLYAASRSQHLHEVIIPALEEGSVVICDRYVDSSLAYQGYARGLGIDRVYELNMYATNGLMPDLTLYFDLDPEIGLNRIKKNNRENDRLDNEQLPFHELVKEGYEKVCMKFPKRVMRINGNQAVDDVYHDVLEVIKRFLGEKHVI